MSEGESYIIPKRDLAEIIQTGDTSALTEFLDDPVPVIAAAITEIFAHGPIALVGPVVRIVQGVLKGQQFRQLTQEIKDVKAKGIIADDFESQKKGFQSWVDLLRVIDEETPDEERLDGLKAMFFAANKVNATDAERIASYQLFQIAKKLNSNDLLVLARVNELRLSTSMHANAYDEWVQLVSANSGNMLKGLIDLGEANLVQYHLLSQRYGGGTGGLYIEMANFRLTDLGIKFHESIQRYHIDKKF